LFYCFGFWRQAKPPKRRLTETAASRDSEESEEDKANAEDVCGRNFCDLSMTTISFFIWLATNGYKLQNVFWSVTRSVTMLVARQQCFWWWFLYNRISSVGRHFPRVLFLSQTIPM